MARSNAASRDSPVDGESMLRSRAALIGAFASSARAAVAHPPARMSATPQATIRAVDILVIDDERMDRMLLELVTAVEECQLDHERDTHDSPAQLIDQAQRRRHRAAGGQEVVHHEDALPDLDRVLVDGERVSAVLELVLDFDGLARQLAQLANGYEAGLQLMGERAAEDEAARFDADDHIDPLVAIAADEAVDDGGERRTVLQDRGDIPEKDSLGREVPDVSDLRLELRDVHRPISYLRCRNAPRAKVSARWWHADTGGQKAHRTLERRSRRRRAKSVDFQPRAHAAGGRGT